MKNFIVILAAIPLLLFFPLQSMLDMQNNIKITAATKIVHNAAQSARMVGYFTDEIQHKMFDELGEYYNADEITYTVTTTPKYRTTSFDGSELIYYEVQVPINKLLVAAGMWGITDDDNKYIYTISGSVGSELLP